MRKSHSHTDAVIHRYTDSAVSSYEEGHTVRVFIPMAQVESERAKRGKHTSRLFKQGLRMFRLGSEHGPIVRIARIDASAGKAVAIGLRKKIHTVALCDLFPMGV